MCYGSSDTKTAMTLLMFPLGSVIVVHTMPEGSGLAWDRGVNNNRRRAAGEELWLRESRRNTSSSRRIKVKQRKLSVGVTVRVKLVYFWATSVCLLRLEMRVLMVPYLRENKRNC